MILTNLTHADGRTATITLEGPDADFNVEEVSLTLQSWLVHNLRSHAGELSSCPCFGCQYKRSRKQWEDGPRSFLAGVELTAERLAQVAKDWSEIAGEPIRVEQIKGAVYGWGGSELGVLRLERKYRSPKARAVKSRTYGWTFSLEI